MTDRIPVTVAMEITTNQPNRETKMNDTIDRIDRETEATTEATTPATEVERILITEATLKAVLVTTAAIALDEREHAHTVVVTQAKLKAAQDRLLKAIEIIRNDDGWRSTGDDSDGDWLHSLGSSYATDCCEREDFTLVGEGYERAIHEFWEIALVLISLMESTWRTTVRKSKGEQRRAAQKKRNQELLREMESNGEQP
jgi:hypothetical protein